LSEASLVIGENLEMLRERRIEDGGPVAKVSSGAADIEEAPPVPRIS